MLKASKREIYEQWPAAEGSFVAGFPLAPQVRNQRRDSSVHGFWPTL